MINFTLPSLGADMDKGKFIAWKIAPGDAVKRGQIVAVIETSKAAVDIEIWRGGTVHELLVQPGETVPVGATLATLLEEGETAESVRHEKPVSPVETVAKTPESFALSQPPKAEKPVPAPAGRRRVSPAARRRAEELNVSIDEVVATSADGSVTFSDVENHSRQEIAMSEEAQTDPQAEMRHAIAAAMSLSKHEIPHYYLSESVPMRKAQQWLDATNTKRSVTDRMLMAALQLKAVALALKQFPDMNGIYRDGMYYPSSAIHIGVAISLRQGGLIAPAIHGVADKSLDTIMHDLLDLVKRARSGSLRSSELTDQTITVTNLGEQGVESVQGVIYPPQVALIGLGHIAERPWAEKGALSVMPVMTASLAADHRVSDGHRGGLFLAAIRDKLQQPEKL